MNSAFTGYIKSIGVALIFRNSGLDRQPVSRAETRIFSVGPNVYICVLSLIRGRNDFIYDLDATLSVSSRTTRFQVMVYLMRKSIAPISEFRLQPTKGSKDS